MAMAAGRRSRTLQWGPLIALVSFVCSIGNVPLAAALWKGGISFGGVVSFIFADLISFPLLLVYRRYYGKRLMARMLVIFWGVMAIAGLVTEVVFRVADLVPVVRPPQVAPTHFSWDYTRLPQHCLSRALRRPLPDVSEKDPLGGDHDHAVDVVCGMQVEVANAPACICAGGQTVLLLLRSLSGAFRC